jgi:hypothetical protein
MPEIFRYQGFRFFFYANEGSPREPVHVHLRKGDATAKFWIKPVRLAENYKFNAPTLRKLIKIIEDNSVLIEKAWYEYFS